MSLTELASPSSQSDIEGRPDSPTPKRRWPRRAAVTLVLVVALLLVVLGTVFSAAVVAPAPAGEPTFGQRVAAVDLDQLVIEDTTDARLAVIGLHTPTGYGRLVGDVVPVDCPVTVNAASCVTRSYVHMAGDRPVAGDAMRLDAYAYPDDPTVFDRAIEEVTVNGELGDLPAWLVPGTDATWVVYVHGRGSTRAEGLRLAAIAADLGHPVLLVSHRGDGIGPDVEIGGFGAREWPDLEAAVAFALERGATDVVLAGTSQGAGTIAGFLTWSERDDLVDAVSALVLDSPLLSLWDTLEQQAGNRGIPGFAHPAVLAVTRSFARVRGFDLAEGEHVDHLAGWDLPTLVFHGDADSSVPVEISDDLAEAAAQLVTYVRGDGIGHIRSWNADPSAYVDAVTAFLTR